MKNILKRALILTVVLCLVISSVVFTASAAPSTYSTAKNSGTRDELCTTLTGTRVDSYYTGTYSEENLLSMSSSSLLSALRKLMTDTHDELTSYDDCKNYADETDCEKENGKITTLYTSYQTTHNEYNSGNGWNREHVWPQSSGGFSKSGPGSDLHHIRPTENKTNNLRGSLNYGEVNGGTEAKGNLSGIVGGYKSGYFEPLDNVKGDVARICLYVYVRWGGDSRYACGNLNKVFSDVDTLLEWCELDPVDTWEMGRNEVVYAIQGNRNVFIDYPELAWVMLGEDIPANMSTPSGGTGEGSSTGGNGGSSEGSGTVSPSVCAHTETTLHGVVNATCTEFGYSGDTKCISCNTVLYMGTTLLPTGHSYGEAVVTRPPTSTDHGEATKTCKNCNDEVVILIEATGEGSDGDDNTGGSSGSEKTEKKGFFARIFEAIKNFFKKLFGKKD